MKTDPYLPARLLSGRPEMSAPEKEAVLGAVLRRVSDVPATRPAGLAWAWLAAGTAAVLLLIGLPLGMGWLDDQQSADSLTARGNGAKPFGVEATCPGDGACRPGSKLIFRVQPPAGRTWFSAFGLRPDGVVVWYFPAEASGQSVQASQEGAGGVLPAGIRLAADHPAGEVALRAQFCSQPLQRPQIRAVYERNADPERFGCTLVEDSFRVSP